MTVTGNSNLASNDSNIIPLTWECIQKAQIKSLDEQNEIYGKSVESPEKFWAEMAEENIVWYKKWDSVLEFNPDIPEVKWFSGGKLNVSYNCLDRHITSKRRNKAALICESDSAELCITLTYQQLYYKVNRFANVLKKHGVKKGDRVTIYLPMIPELVIAMLACARIGAVHNVVFGGFSANALKERLLDSESKLLITGDNASRAEKIIPLKTNADEAVHQCPSIKRVIVVKITSASLGNIAMKSGRDSWWHDEINDNCISNYCEPEWMDAEDPLFILYTSGSTGKPKGVLHTTGGYLLYTHLTYKWIFDYHEEDIHFCTADIGWVTGHSYIVYGPLSNGSTNILFDGTPTYPDPGRLWEIVEKNGANIFYTAPTALRALMKEGEMWINKYDLSSLRLLGSVGEPINPEAWKWYFKNVGKSRLPIVDTWWQTETGGILITPIPGVTPLKPGSASKPFPGIVASVLRDDGTPADVNEGGYLVIDKPWPGMIRGTYGDMENKRVRETYFSKYPGKYLTGDGAKIDDDGYFWLLGRIDDVVNVSGHRIGTAEVESALVSHETVAEAAVVGYPHNIRGEGLYAYVILKHGYEPSEELRKALVRQVRKEIGPIAAPDKLQFVPGLPKTRSGKIMRRILRKIAGGETAEFGDVSTLADPSILGHIVEGRIE
ncbi:MAG: acetate--CoA ligase [Ruminiclostridium sp.]|nr:acetate--CoA ligase [Ruminiclostridium sp.]